MIRPAIEIARALPSLANATDDEVREWTYGVHVTFEVGSVPLSRGEMQVVAFAVAAEEMLNRCDADTVDGALERLDRMRAGMVR